MTDALTHLTHISSTTVNLTYSFCCRDENQISAAHRKNASGASVRQEVLVDRERAVQVNSSGDDLESGPRRGTRTTDGGSMNSIPAIDDVREIALVSEVGISLAHYQRMCVAIAEAGAVDEVKDIRDRALALEDYSKRAKNTELEAVVVRIRIRAERRAGELLRDMPKAKGAAEPGTSRGVTPSDATRASHPLSDLGISYDQSSRWQKLADVPFERFERALAKTEKKLSTTGIIKLGLSVVDENHRAGGTGENEWYTPAEYVGAARDFLGGVDLDPASSALANETVQAAMFHSQEDDGLSQEWIGRVWLNPPYAQPWIARFMMSRPRSTSNDAP